MLKNIFMAQLGFELTTLATPPSTALSVTSTDCAIETTQKKDCSNSADIGINGEIIINSANMYLINLLPKRFRLSASSEV